MNKYNFFILLFIISSNSFSSEISCVPSTTSTPPFFISDTYKQGDRIYENLRSLEDRSVKTHYINKGSIVHVDQSIYQQTKRGQYLPVEIISTPLDSEQAGITDQTDRRNRFNYLKSGSNNLEHAKIGVKGFLNKKSLKPAGKYRFLLKEDSILYERINKEHLPNLNISLKMEGRRYQTNKCCYENNGVSNLKCFDEYKYEIFQNNTKIKELSLNNNSCTIFDSLSPMSKKDFDSINGILNTLNMVYGDLTVLPGYKVEHKTVRPNLVKFPIKKLANAYHYKSDDKASSDLFTLPSVGCVFSKAIKEFGTKCKTSGCQVQIGDMYHNNTWGVHHRHDNAKCVDIRPFRLNEDLDYGITIMDKHRYDSKKTCQFIKTMQKYGASYIDFGDTSCDAWALKNLTKGTHLDHLHVCFNNSLTVKKKCAEK